MNDKLAEYVRIARENKEKSFINDGSHSVFDETTLENYLRFD